MTVSIINQKGGTGKTTTALALVYAGKQDGKRVLLIDLDPQCNATFSTGMAADQSGTFALIESARTQLATCAHIVNGIAVVPACWNLSTVVTKTGSALRLRDKLSAYRQAYDLIIIDTPPTMGELQYNALFASDAVVVPLQADIFSLQGLQQTAGTLKEIRKHSAALKHSASVITRYDGRSLLSRQMRDTITGNAESIGVPVIGCIREGVAIREAQASRSDIIQYAPKAKPIIDYIALYDTISQWA